MNKYLLLSRVLVVLLLSVGVFTAWSEDITEAYFAGGCFWCMEPPFEGVKGVEDVISGYAGGEKPNPTYNEVAGGRTKYLETVKVVYDADVISYETLLNIFWRQIDPTDDGGQFVDRGYQYTTAIFYVDEDQKKLAESSKEGLNNSGWLHNPVVTPIREYTNFYDAEEYHQDYYKKNKRRYKYYRKGSGRDYFIDKTWGKYINFTSPIEKKK